MGEKMTSVPNFTLDEWKQLIHLSQLHHVLPLVFETLNSIPAFQSLPFFTSLRVQVRNQVLIQIQKTAEFQLLYQCFCKADLHP